MTNPIPPEVIRKIRKLAKLPAEARHSPFGVSITRLTVLKSLCREHQPASRFVTFLAQRTQQKVEDKAKRPGYLSMEEWARHRQMIDRGVTALETFLERPSEQERSQLRTLLQGRIDEQNEHRRVYGGPVRIIRNKDLLLVEYALRTVLADQGGIPMWAYQTARCYAERSDASHGGDLTPASAPLLQDIADFWIKELGLSAESIAMPKKASKPKEKKSPAKASRQKIDFTERQGQFLAFIPYAARTGRSSSNSWNSRFNRVSI